MQIHRKALIHLNQRAHGRLFHKQLYAFTRVEQQAVLQRAGLVHARAQPTVSAHHQQCDQLKGTVRLNGA
jgi:hypothetical protein